MMLLLWSQKLFVRFGCTQCTQILCSYMAWEIKDSQACTGPHFCDYFCATTVSSVFDMIILLHLNLVAFPNNKIIF